VKVDVALRSYQLSDAADAAADLEALGYDGVWTAEVAHDPFLPIPLIAASTSRVSMGTGIAVAFARTPMLLAYLGSDLQTLSGGRFILGLGSQVKAHITRRFSMPWSQPAARMREMVLAIRAIWSSFETGEKLSFEGDFYRHTLMNEEFSPGPAPFGWPPIFVAGVGARMAETAGEVADGLLLHSFTTERYLREVTLPAVERGLARSGRDRRDFTIVCQPFVVTGATEASVAETKNWVRRRVAWYGSTPAYRPVLDVHGWADLGAELHGLSRSDLPDRLEKMQELVPDEVLNTFAVVAEPGDLAAALIAKFGTCADRLRLNPTVLAPGMAPEAIRLLHGA
jgi:probable F420-dependent oxidoreductase